MAPADSHPATGFSAPRQPPDLTLENACVPSVPPNNQQEDMPPPASGRGVAEPGRMQDLHYIDPAYQGIVDYRPQPLANPANVLPDVAHAQDNPVQIQPNDPVDQEHDLFGYVPPHVAPGLVQVAFPHPFVHRNPTPDPPQARAENLRQLAGHYLHHPDAHVRMITMEAGPAGRIKVAVIFETPDF